MSDDLTPAQTDAVRRSLRAARHDAPLPDEVAARLDDRLAELVAERSDDAAVAPVVPIRRRRWPAVLAAAAAVTAIGLAGSQLVDRGGHADSLTTADRAEATAPSPSDLDSLADNDGNLDGAYNSVGAASGALPFTLAPELRAELADQGIHRVRMITPGMKALDSVQGDARTPHAPESTSSDMKSMAAAACQAELPAHIPADAELFRALRGSTPVILLLRPDGDATRVSAYPCDGGAPTALTLD